nr:hypothetical protein GPGIFMOB_00130 [Acinetobacter gerneri]
MSFKTLLLTGLLSVGLVLVGCSKKEESTSQSKPIQPDEQIDKVDPSADLQARVKLMSIMKNLQKLRATILMHIKKLQNKIHQKRTSKMICLLC